MRKLLIIIVTFLSFSVVGETLNVIKVVSTPKDFYVGDLVTLHIYVETPFEDILETPKEIPVSDWIDIKSVNLVDNGSKESIIRLSFTSFSPGLKLIPDIFLGNNVLHDLKIQTLSMLDDQFTELQPLSPQMVPPGTNLIVVFLFLGVVFGPFLIFLIWRAMYRSIKIAIKKYKREKPFRKYYKVLKRLRGDIKEKSVRDFYVLIIEQLRIYLAIRFNSDFSSATTMEMDLLLQTVMDSDSTEELLSICRFADLVKFSHTNASVLHREKDLITIIDILYQLEGKDNVHAHF